MHVFLLVDMWPRLCGGARIADSDLWARIRNNNRIRIKINQNVRGPHGAMSGGHFPVIVGFGGHHRIKSVAPLAMVESIAKGATLLIR
ncbi:hypothetical protein C4J81_17325 [Deltaproteobacteria bacterium Smac51]|nr:hypothetical protein C4J81_17325 [Deltaproteobacteria bacterium Smac51]